MRKTKIICTMGPSTDQPGVLEKLIETGMDVARFNFSHGDHEEQKGRFVRLKKARYQADRPVAALLDTKGPEIRIRDFKDGKIMLEKGQKFTLTIREIEGDNTAVSITCKELVNDVKPGNEILIDDGLIGMIVDEVTDTDIVCTVQNPGPVSNRKGVNVPNVNLSMPFISEKDYNDIVFGIKTGYDFIAASFTRSAQDIRDIKKILEEHDGLGMKIIAKIENRQGVDNIDEILAEADGIMVARGDMGVEIPLEELPVIQKRLIRKAMDAGKIVITATQMLDSMMKNPRPTRAETTDVANAIYDGTGAIMLSGETAAGKYPVETLETMIRIAERTEASINYIRRFERRSTKQNQGSITEAISYATCSTAHDLEAAAIVTVTKSGRTAHTIAKYRPQCPIIGCTTTPMACRQLSLCWGVTPIQTREEEDTFELFDHSLKEAERAGYLKKGDIAVITAGLPMGMSGTTNMINVHVVGEPY
ncbi:MAG: pyruvate kinase [Lachnospiraceae bacterium]|nr:pyruvate kinase [Lachnospiraceae bacterium]